MTRPAAPLLAGLVVLAGACLLAESGHAATVVIVRPEGASAAMRETVVRLRGELASVGFATEIVDAPAANAKSSDWLEGLASRRAAEAVVAFVGAEEATSVEVWVMDKVTDKPVVRRIASDGDSERGPDRLAIRALELLRSSFAEIDLRSLADPGSTAPPADAAAIVQTGERSRSERIGIEAGGAGVMSLDGVGPAFLPMLDVSVAPTEALSFYGSVAGFGSRAAVEGQTGSAEVSQAYALLGGRLRFRSGEWLQPFVSLGAGVLRTAAEGRGGVGFEGRSTSQWSFVGDAALGAVFRLRDRFYCRLGVHAQIAEPYPAIRFAGTVMATAARPNLLVTVTAGAWL